MTSEEIIEQITKIRARNNRNWMNILRLAFRHAPAHAKQIMSSISACDSEVTKLTRKLGKVKEV